ncbi:MAG: NlpC/P60 family protein [Candidatus Pacebacteria bacterium]|nr:NlpC/P60 family protein [Candidatus Paceibacterota bacterium]
MPTSDTTSIVKEICDNNIDDNGDNLADGKDPQCYFLLAPLPGLSTINTTQGLPAYLKVLYRLAIGIAGVIAVVIIVWAGIEYMMSDVVFKKDDAKQRIWNALGGLVLLIGSFVLLNTINPDLLNLNPRVPIKEINIEEEVGGDTGDVFIANYTSPSGIFYPRSGGASQISRIVSSLDGKVTYRFGGKGGPAPYPSDTKMCENGPCKNYCPPGTVCLDCSGFINYIYVGAGIAPINGGTGTIFSSSEKITKIENRIINGETATYVNDIALKTGDLLGWVANENGNKVGHVVMYIGNGQAVESTSGGNGRSSGNGLKKLEVTQKYLRKEVQLLTRVKRL